VGGVDDLAPRLLDAVPHGIDEARIVRVRGDAVLVVQEARVGVLDQELERLPHSPTVGRAVVGHAVVAEATGGKRIGVGDEAHRVQRPVRRERQPRIGRPIERAAGAGRAHRHCHLRPTLPAIVAPRDHVALRGAVRPAVLLVDTDDVERVGRVDVNPRSTSESGKFTPGPGPGGPGSQSSSGLVADASTGPSAKKGPACAVVAPTIAAAKSSTLAKSPIRTVKRRITYLLVDDAAPLGPDGQDESPRPPGRPPSGGRRFRSRRRPSASRS
jgi:hypothetical protein